MAYIAIVRVDGERVGKYASFETEAEATAHVAEHGGFVVNNPPGNSFTWRVVGQAVTDEAPPEPVPDYVTRYQFKKAVMNSGQLQAVQQAAAGLTDEAKLYWQDADKIGRDSILITELQAELNISDSAIDNFFRNAVRIKP